MTFFHAKIRGGKNDSNSFSFEKLDAKNWLLIFEISNIANKKQGKARKQELSKALSSPFKGSCVFSKTRGRFGWHLGVAFGDDI